MFVDDARLRYGRMVMFHMIADTPDELHAMAQHIGIARRWYQQDASTPHYDICLSKRILALRHGAWLITDRRAWVGHLQRVRANWPTQQGKWA